MSNKNELFNDFCDFIQTDVRDEKNPSLGVKRKPGTDSYEYLIVYLKNVSLFDANFFDSIIDFREGTRVSGYDSPEEGTTYEVLIPLSTKQRSSKRYKDRPNEIINRKKPDVIELLILIIVFMVIAGVGSRITTTDDWWFVNKLLK